MYKLEDKKSINPTSQSHLSVNYVIQINLIALIVYCAFFIILKLSVSEQIMYSTPDSQSYLAVANWLSHGNSTGSTEIRPILYPLVILGSSLIGNIYGLWLVQLIFWLLTVNISFLSIYKLTTNYIYSYAGVAIILSNLSLIALTTHALTEIMTIFLLSILVFTCINNIKNFSEPKFLTKCVAIMILLTLTKPVFLIPLMILIVLIFPVFYLRKFLNNPRQFLVLALIFLPLVSQFSIMKIKHNRINVSMIGPLTFRRYFFAKGIEIIENVDRPESIRIAQSFPSNEIINYIIRNKTTYINEYLDNLEGNIKSRPTYLKYPEQRSPEIFYDVMTYINKSYFYIHALMQLLAIYSLFILYRGKEYNKIIMVLIFFFLVDFYILSTGISFWQGDRLVLPTIAIWPVFYLFTLRILEQNIRRTWSPTHL